MDFRTYLQQQADSGNRYAQQGLNYVGNDFTGQGTAGVDIPSLEQWNSLTRPGGQTGSGAQTQEGYSSSLNQVLDPLRQLYFQFNPQQPTNNLPSGGGGGSSNADDIRYLDDQISLIKKLLGNADSTLQSGLRNVDNSYRSGVDDANLRRTQTLEDYGLQREDAIRGKEASLGQVDNNSRTLADSLRRILGQASGSGSSAFKFAAPNAIARVASGQREGVLGSYGENERNLSIAEGRSTTAFDKLLEELALDRAQQEASLRADIFGQKQGIYTDIADLQGRKAKLQGGGYDQVRSAQQPYLDKYQEYQQKIQALPANYNQRIKVNPVNPQKVNLRDYIVDKAGINVNNQSGGVTNSPYQFFLKKKFQEQGA